MIVDSGYWSYKKGVATSHENLDTSRSAAMSFGDSTLQMAVPSSRGNRSIAQRCWLQLYSYFAASNLET